MSEIIKSITTHPFIWFGSYVLFMLATQALPKPDEHSGPFYRWLYTFMHLLSANLGLVWKFAKAGGIPLPDGVQNMLPEPTPEHLLPNPQPGSAHNPQ
jgi:hypothetical protein